MRRSLEGEQVPVGSHRHRLRGFAAGLALAAVTSCTAGHSPGTIVVTGPPPADHSPAVTISELPAPSAPVQPATLPADLEPAPPVADCARQPRTGGWTAAENDRPGSPVPAAALRWDRTGTTLVEGYPTQSSAQCGDVVHVALSGPSRRVQLVAYRVGAYHGSGARQVWQSGPVDVWRRPVPPAGPAGAVIPTWPNTVDVPITAAWPPGVYLLVPMADGVVAGAAIPLVVRAEAGNEPVLFMASTLTWAAYNTWGGRSLYHGDGGSRIERYQNRARIVALHRPIDSSGWRQVAEMDLVAVRWLEAQGLDVDYTTDVALDDRPSQLVQHAELVTGGHSEYWTRRMYDTLDAALSRGVNVAFLGGNNVWWQARVEGNGARMVVYRAAAEDPEASSTPDLTTMNWGQGVLARDISERNGQSHTAIDARGGLQLINPPAWLVAGTSLRHGSVLPGAVGNEADGYKPLAHHPAQLQVLALGILNGAKGPAYVGANYAANPSGAGFFAAGNTYWSCSLLGACSEMAVPVTTSQALSALSHNVLVAFAQPRAALSHPVQPWVPDPPAKAQLGAGAIGHYN